MAHDLGIDPGYLSRTLRTLEKAGLIARAPDGADAVILANITRERQSVTLEWQGKTRSLTLPPAEALVIR